MVSHSILVVAGHTLESANCALDRRSIVTVGSRLELIELLPNGVEISLDASSVYAANDDGHDPQTNDCCEQARCTVTDLGEQDVLLDGSTRRPLHPCEQVAHLSHLAFADDPVHLPVGGGNNFSPEKEYVS